MPTYILLLTLTPQGREWIYRDAESVIRAADNIAIPGIQQLGFYGVLGQYDFVSILEAPDNEAVARFSIELGVKAGVHVTSLPAIPIGRLEPQEPWDISQFYSSAAITPEEEPGPEDELR